MSIVRTCAVGTLALALSSSAIVALAAPASALPTTAGTSDQASALVDEYVPNEVDPPEVAVAGAPAIVTLDVSTNGVVSGTVVDNLGAPSTNQAVQISATSREGSIERTARTTSTGEYERSMPLPSGRYTIVAVANGVSSPSATVTLTPGIEVKTKVRPVRSEGATVLSIGVRDRGYLAPAKFRIAVREPNDRSWRPLFAGATTTGLASIAVRPWRNPVYQVRVFRRGIITEATVTGRTVGAVGPALPPRGSPVPRIPYPLVDRPIGLGALAVIKWIPEPVWRGMQGRSWRPGCVPRASLRVVESNYFGFDGYRHRGQIVVAAAVARKVQIALMRLYAGQFRIRQMRPVDAYGRNVGGRPGANDYASMAADNTSGFNCRYVVGKEPEHVQSPHASGRSIDVNPWENPYVSRRGTFPNSYFLNRRIGFHGTFRPGLVGLAAVAGVGCRWGGSYSDFHHFDC